MNNKNKTTWIQIRCTPIEKSAIVRQLKDNEKLSQFMLEAAAEKIDGNKRIAELEALLIEEYNYGTLERRDIEHLIPRLSIKGGDL